MKNKNAVLKILAELCRLLIGVVFIFSGFVKAVDPMGGAIKIGEYLASFGLDMLQPFTVLLSFNLSAIEFTLGVCMLLGVYRRYVSFLVFWCVDKHEGYYLLTVGFLGTVLNQFPRKICEYSHSFMRW